MRRIVRTIGWVGLVCVLAVIAFVGGVYVTHPRDEGAFLNYVKTYSQYPRKQESRPSSVALIQAGNRACDWLSHQIPALWRTGSGHTVNDLYRSYGGADADADLALPSAVVPGAWTYLCPATELLVKPHYVFSDPPGD